MAFKYELRPEVDGLITKTDVLSTLRIWTDDGPCTRPPNWSSNYGEALMDYAVEWGASRGLADVVGFWVLDDFASVLRLDEMPDDDIIGMALRMKFRKSTFFKDMVTTTINPATFQDWKVHSKYFALNVYDNVVLFDSPFSVKVWLEEHVDPEPFVKWIAETKVR